MFNVIPLIALSPGQKASRDLQLLPRLWALAVSITLIIPASCTSVLILQELCKSLCGPFQLAAVEHVDLHADMWTPTYLSNATAGLDLKFLMQKTSQSIFQW